MLNGVDLLIIFIFVVAAYWGAKRGVHAALLDIGCIVAGLAVGLVGYPLGWKLVRKLLALPDVLSGPLGFLLMVAIGATAGGLIGGRLVRQREAPSVASRVGGGALNVLMAYLVLGIFLRLMAGVEEPNGRISRSRLAPPLLAIVPDVLRIVELPGLDLPRVVAVPRWSEGEFEIGATRYPTFRPLNFSKLNGSTCINCRGKMRFLGYYFKDAPLPSPKFQCAQCERTSDGCQGFESFHKLYQECPVTLAQQRIELDCGVWTNGEAVVPLGECPVCGKEVAPSPEYWVPRTRRRPSRRSPRLLPAPDAAPWGQE